MILFNYFTYLLTYLLTIRTTNAILSQAKVFKFAFRINTPLDSLKIGVGPSQANRSAVHLTVLPGSVLGIHTDVKHATTSV